MFNSRRHLTPRLLKNQSGSIVLGALAVAAVVGILSAVVATQIQSTDEISQLPRVRAAMAQIEIQTRMMVYSPTTYKCEYPTGGNYTCEFKTDVFNRLKFKLDKGTVEVKDQTFGAEDHVFHAQIAYIPEAGTSSADSRVQIAPRVLSIEVPSEILQPTSFLCPSDKPIFAGYFQNTVSGQHKKGQPDCRALPTTTCNPGQYISSLNPQTLEPVCTDAGTYVACAYGQFFDRFDWNNGKAITTHCIDRKDPFTDMGYNYLARTTVDLTFYSQDADTPDPVAPSLPTPEVVTWSNPNPQPASGCYTPPPVNCVGSFSTCSATCGGGYQVYSITTPASNGGAACSYSNGQSLSCNTQACSTPTPAPDLVTGCYIRVSRTAPFGATYDTTGTLSEDGSARLVDCGTAGDLSFSCNRNSVGTRRFCAPDLDGTERQKGNVECMCSAVPLPTATPAPTSCTMALSACTGGAITRVTIGELSSSSGTMQNPSTTDVQACTALGGTCIQAEAVSGRGTGSTGLYKMFCHTGTGTSAYQTVNGSGTWSCTTR